MKNMELEGIQEVRNSFKTIEEARKALLKINSDETAFRDFSRLLSTLMKETPLEVYAFASELLRDPQKPLQGGVEKGVEDIARSAARNALCNPQLGTWTSRTNIESDDYDRFTSYHRRCSDRLVQLLETGDLIENAGTDWIWHSGRCESCSHTPETSNVVLKITKQPTTWWAKYWGGVIASVRDRPCKESFENDQTWDSTLETLELECPTCYETAKEQYPRFKQKVVQMITVIIDRVRIHFSTALPARGLIFISQVEL